jgi:hypothetical protein
MSLSIAQQTATEKVLVPTVYFVELALATATQRFCSWNAPINWGGQLWSGVGTLGNISEIEHSEDLDARSLTLSLNIAQQSWLTIAVGAVQEYSGRDARIYFCPLNEGYQLIDTPQLCWTGFMDTMSVGIDGDSGSIQLRCENSVHRLKRQPILRLNAANQKLKYPTDTGFDYLTDLISKPQLWLSKRFQGI